MYTPGRILVCTSNSPARRATLPVRQRAYAAFKNIKGSRHLRIGAGTYLTPVSTPLATISEATRVTDLPWPYIVRSRASLIGDTTMEAERDALAHRSRVAS
jgi:hypothetical protein